MLKQPIELCYFNVDVGYDYGQEAWVDDNGLAIDGLVWREKDLPNLKNRLKVIFQE